MRWATYREQVEGGLSLDHHLVDLVVGLALGAEHVADLLFFFVAGLPRGNEVVRLKQGALLDVGRAHVQTVLVQHDVLAVDLLVLASALHTQAHPTKSVI